MPEARFPDLHARGRNGLALPQMGSWQYADRTARAAAYNCRESNGVWLIDSWNCHRHATRTPLVAALWGVGEVRWPSVFKSPTLPILRRQFASTSTTTQWGTIFPVLGGRFHRHDA